MTTTTETLSFGARALLAKNPLARQLLELMEAKKTNLVVNADVTSKEELLRFAEIVGTEICLLKTHVDMLDDFDTDFVVRLQKLAEEKNFLLFEDRKFSDIGHIVKHQYAGGIYRIADWAHVTNAHVVSGEGVIAGLREVGKPKGRGLLLVAEMSSSGALATGSYTEAALKMAEDNEDFVLGFICQQKLSTRPGLIHFTPGVNLQTAGDTLGQMYRDPASVVGKRGSDAIIVGRGVIKAEDPLKAAKAYRQAGWDAYQSRVGG